jgi:AcrR family transcriptional regulator
MAPGRKRSDHAHEAILAATRATLQELGYNQMTVEGIASQAGVGKATIYRWWPTKAELVIEAISHLVEDPPPLTGHSHADVRAMIDRMIGVMAGPVGQVLPAIASELAENAAARKRLADLLGPVRAANQAVLLSAAGRGDLPHDIDTAAVLDTLAGAILFRRLMLRPLDADFAEQLTNFVLSGQRPRTSANGTDIAVG